MSEKAFILIIEDDADFAAVLKAILETHGYEIDTVDRPDIGLQRALDRRPDLIVLDVMFGREGKTEGFDCALRIREEKALASIPILMVTAVNAHFPGFRFSDRTDGEYLPVDGFVEKPVLPLDLVEEVRSLLARKTSKWKNWPLAPDGIGTA